MKGRQKEFDHLLNFFGGHFSDACFFHHFFYQIPFARLLLRQGDACFCEFQQFFAVLMGWAFRIMLGRLST